MRKVEFQRGVTLVEAQASMQEYLKEFELYYEVELDFEQQIYKGRIDMRRKVNEQNPPIFY